jgi:hypothetical protein
MPSRETAAGYSLESLRRIRCTKAVQQGAYDLFYVLQYYGSGVHDVIEHLAPLLRASPDAQRAMEILRDDFADPNGDGASAVATFLFGRSDEDLQADVAGFTRSLLAFFGMAP